MRRSGNHNIDVAVVGGGPSGAAAALALRRLGYSTVVIERSDYRGVRIGETLPPAVKPLLVSLGVWDQFVAQNHSLAFSIRSAWGGDNLYDNDFIFNPYGAGWHVDRVCFDEMLANCAEQAGAGLYRNARLLSCENCSAGWRIAFADDDGQHRFRAKFLVDATGRTSYVARKQGAKRITGDRLIGVFFFFSLNSRKSAIDVSTLIEAVEDGWWYSAGLPD
ncbi:MAG: NAD(P)/FAD-dependent oxidoreductase, partial [Pyrinomonadaceae bacterium]